MPRHSFYVSLPSSYLSFFFYLFLSVKMTDVEEFVSVAVDEDFVCAVQSKGVLSSLSASEFKR